MIKTSSLRILKFAKKPVKFILFFLFVFLISFPLVAETKPQDVSKEPAINFLVRDRYFIAPKLKLAYDTRESEGFLLTREDRPNWNSKYAVVTGFDGTMVETRSLIGVRSPNDITRYIKKNGKLSEFMKVPIKELALAKKDGSSEPRYWVGQQSFSSLELAQASVIAAKTEIETSGGNFKHAIDLIYEYAPEEPKALSEQEIKANFAREEEMAVKLMDWLDIGEKPYGILSSPSPWGEKLLWQSFGETTFRTTNLESDEYNAQTGFWVNRMVVKGFRGPFDTSIDPYVEIVPSLETNGIDYKSYMKLVGGLQWYPFIRNAVLQNYKPWGIPILDFMRNSRVFIHYLYRENLKDEITGSKDTDLWAGVDLYYEWGYALPSLGDKPKSKFFTDYLRNYVWGEYYGTYHWEKTNFSSIPHYQSWVLNSSLSLGVKWPTISLPANPINNELTFMPYLRFEHVTNPNHPLHYQNYFLTAAGMRIMPFRSYQFSENEWLFKTKLFVEYIGIPSAIRYSANTASNTPGRDLRFGISFSYRRI